MTPGDHDERVVLTLDAGGTSFRFSALRGGRAVTEVLSLPSQAEDLDRCLTNIVAGFTRIKQRCPQPPVAISFAFPGPADYPQGIIGDLPNLPAFRGGVALGPMLEERFGVPVFINNDGDLFAYGEAIAGLLPQVNGLLAKAGSAKQYRNLVGLTIGTGLGGGLVRDGELFLGDNAMAGEVWLLRNKLQPAMNAEEGASIRAVRRVYAERSGVPREQAPDPKVIHDIALGKAAGDAAAARAAFAQLGEVAGDALASALTLIDGLAVIGGGISGAWPLFLPALVAELNGTYTSPDGRSFRRLASTAFNLEDPAQMLEFLRGETRAVRVPGSARTVTYDPLPRVGVGISRLGTSQAVAVGACAFALRKLDER
jgi:glucokinase